MLDPHKYSYLTKEEEKMVWNSWTSTQKESRFRPIPFIKINSKCITNLNAKLKIIKLQKTTHIEENLDDLGFGNDSVFLFNFFLFFGYSGS